MRSRLDGSDRDIKNRRGFFVCQAAVMGEEENHACVFRQSGESGIKGAAFFGEQDETVGFALG